jgi:hypothetical protein
MFVQIYKSECLKKEQVPGLGDIACWYSKDHEELQVLKGSMILTFGNPPQRQCYGGAHDGREEGRGPAEVDRVLT